MENKTRLHRIEGKGFVPNHRARFKTVTVLVASTLLLAFSGYHTLFGNRELSEFVVYFVVPVGLILLVLRENPLHYGLAPGNWRRGLVYTAGGIVLMAVILSVAARMPAFQSYYGTHGSDSISLRWVLSTGVALFAWEFFFRGFMLFGLEEGLGWYAAIVQAVPFTLVHAGKPELETYACIVGGTLIGLVGLRVRSFYPAFFIHWFIAVALNILVRGGLR
jgi:membrane protease YdiL (CAAX protease family)